MSAKTEPPVVDLAREADFQLGALTIRPSLLQIENNGASETLQPRIMQVLVVLARRHGDVVSRDELIQVCWSGRAVGEDSLNRCISKTRALGETSGAFSLDTIPRVGYRLRLADTPALPVGNNFPSPSSPVIAPASPQDSPIEMQAPLKRRWRSLPVLASAAAALILVVVAGYWTMRGSKVVAVTAERIAVLPFSATGGDKIAETVAQSAPIAIADALYQSGFSVIAPAQTQAYVGSRKATAAHDLGAAYIMDGESKIGDGAVELTLRLSDAGGLTIWTRTLARPSDNSVELVTQAGLVTAEALGWMNHLGGGSATDQANNMRSIAEMKKGEYLASYESARRLAQQDPDSSYALVNEVMQGYFALPQFPPEGRAALVAHLRKQAARAATLRPRHQDVRLAEAVLVPEVEWARREAIQKSGVDEASGANAMAMLAYQLVQSGRATEAAPLYRQALVKDPGAPSKLAGPPTILLAQGRTADARKEAARLYQLFPDDSEIARLYFFTLLSDGAADQAVTFIADDKVRDLVDPPAEIRPARDLAKAMATRSPADIDALARDCASTAPLSAPGASRCLRGLAVLGRLNQAFALADDIFPDIRGATPAERDAKWLAHPGVIDQADLLFEAALAPLRADKRFIDLTTRIGLADDWRETGKWPDFCATEPGSVCGAMKARTP